MFAEDANNTLWTSGGGAGRRLAEHEDVRRDPRRGEVAGLDGARSSTPTATASATRTSSPISRSIRRRTSASAARFYAVVAGAGRIDLGIGARISGRGRPAESRAESARDGAGGSVRAAVQRSECRRRGYSPRGMDVDRNGVVWAALASGHLASFDRRKCKGPLNGPKATGQHCPEGWTLYPEPLPQFKGVTDVGQRGSQLLHLGRSVRHARARREHRRSTPATSRKGCSSLKDGKWVVLRVPYPIGFYTKWLDGRIDDPKGGWKGRGLWATVSTRAPFHMETGKGTTSKVMHFQLRPDPLAK